MIRMPTLYIRNVPPEVYEVLKARAKREGRSVNAEALKVLEEVAEHERRAGSLAHRLRELAEKIDYPPDAPRAHEIVRQMRDERAEELLRRASGDQA